MRRHRSKGAPASCAVLLAFLAAGAAAAQDEKTQDDFEKALESALEKERAESLRAEPQAPAQPTLFSAPIRLVDLSLDGLIHAGTSSERDASIRNLELGGHDPQQRGFTVANIELSAVGAVDPYFNAEAHLIYFLDPEGESQFELEEAFATTTALPYGLQLEAGQFFTEFGRVNPQHPHQWDFVDQPVINGRVFGPDGMRGPGARLGWLTPLPWFAELHVGLQNARGETMTSFLSSDEAGVAGGHVFEEHDSRSLADYAWLARLHQSWDPCDEVVVQLGASGLWGPNAAGRTTRTSIYGGDLRVKWQPRVNDAGWPFVIWQSEVIHRNYGTELQEVADPDGVPASGDEVMLAGDTLRDTGLYTQLLWGFERDWIAGLRYECAKASGAGLVPRDVDPLRDDRVRLSPLLTWQPTHYSRLRLQYNLDVADHLRFDRAHSAWLSLEFAIGAHPAHKY